MVEAFKENREAGQYRDAWMIRWILCGLIEKPPSIDAILGKQDDEEISVEGLSALLSQINQSGKWDA